MCGIYSSYLLCLSYHHGHPSTCHTAALRQLACFCKGLYKHPTLKMAGALQSGLLLCLQMTAVIFCTQPNNKNISFFLITKTKL